MEMIEFLFCTALGVLVLVLGIFGNKHKKLQDEAIDNLRLFMDTFELMKTYYPQHIVTQEEYAEIKKNLIHNYMLVGGGLDNECCGKEYLVRLVGIKELDECYIYRCTECGKTYVCVWG